MINSIQISSQTLQTNLKTQQYKKDKKHNPNKQEINFTGLGKDIIKVVGGASGIFFATFHGKSSLYSILHNMFSNLNAPLTNLMALGLLANICILYPSIKYFGEGVRSLKWRYDFRRK